MAKAYEWIKLSLENWKTVLSILTLLIGLVSSGVGNILQSETVYSYKMGYEALAHNDSVAQQGPKLSTSQPKVVNVKTCDCQHLEKAIQLNIKHIKELRSFHALN